MNMKFTDDFKEKVRTAVNLLIEANRAVETGGWLAARTCAYNSMVMTIHDKYPDQWEEFRNRAFKPFLPGIGLMDSRYGKFNPFRPDLPKKRTAAAA